MPKLNWISDTDLTNAVTQLLGVATEAKQNAEKKFGKNVVDPFSAIFEMAGFDMGFDNWVVGEQARQAQKTLQNFIGDFHQTVLGSCKDWDNLKVGNIIDLLNKDKMVIAEIKNKYNTISGGQLANLYKSLESAVMDKTSVYKNYTAYYVEVIPKKAKRYNKLFTPSDKQTGNKCAANPLIRQIDGASFYDIVTAQPNALEALYDVLPGVIAGITNSNTIDKQKVKSLFKMAYG